MTDRFPEALSHGSLEEVFPEVFFVTGTSKPNFQGKDFQFSRNMTVVREGKTLTLVNTVRLDAAGLERLDALGRVANVVRIGAFHGRDDAFYADRYRAPLWALPGTRDEHGGKIDRELSAGSLPIQQCRLFAFESTKAPEGVLLLERHGGILIACDSLQNWLGPDRYFDDASAEMMGGFGFFKAANVGPAWRRTAEPKALEF